MKTKLAKARRAGVLGGVFDPVHFGHLNMAQAAAETLDLDVVLFVPSGRPPHKNISGVTPAAHRLKMLSLGVRDNPRFKLTDIEIKNKGVSYTADTLKAIKAFMPGEAKLYLLIGEDNAEFIKQWKDFETILSLCEIAVYPRGGGGRRGAVSDGFTYLGGCAALEINSSDIRAKVASVRSVAYLTPACVKAYIDDTGLYRLARAPAREIMKYAEKTLTKNRFLHTCGAVDEAVRLARLYGEDEKKAELAALLHDLAKEASAKKKLEMCAKYRVKLPEYLRGNITLAHGALAAHMAKERFGVTDRDVLNAVSYHTTGRKNMSRLEKIVYLADRIEPYRPYSDELVMLREAAGENLDRAVIMCLSASVARLKGRGAYVSPKSAEALKFLTRAAPQN